MRSTFKVIGTGLIGLAAISLLSIRNAGEQPAQLVKDELIRKTADFETAVHQLQKARPNELQRCFREARYAYKKMEWAVEYFDPITARLVNGPPVPEAELNGKIIQPGGLQVIERCIYPSLNQRKKLTDQLAQLAINAAKFKEFFQKTDLQDWQIIDAIKQEVFRVEVLGLNDFDDPLQKNCFTESAMAIQALQYPLDLYKADVTVAPTAYSLQHAVNFTLFDRTSFIKNKANQLTRGITQLQTRLRLNKVRYNRLLNQDAATLFDKNAFNRNAYTAAPEDSATEDKIALGKKLFFDPILSGNGKRSCATCHQPEKAFTDGLMKNLDVTGKKFIARNTPSLINAALQPAQFYDLRSPSLEDQANDVVGNKDEMHGDMKIAIGKLWHDADYRKLFTKAYPAENKVAIDTFEVMNALASYIRSLTLLNSRFDKYMRGDDKALTSAEIAGFNIFMGKAKCSTCHYLPLFNGALPPRYMQMEAEVIGVPEKRGGHKVDPDPGTYGIQPLGFNKYAFKTTTVRNTAKTPPYMHNGVFNNLQQVIDFYNRGGAKGEGIHLPNQTLDEKPLHLTKIEQTQLIAFIKSLDSAY